MTADIYPYIRNGIGLAYFLPPSHFAAGREAFLASLSDPQIRRQLRSQIEDPHADQWENWYRHVGADWSKVQIIATGRFADASLVGLSVAGAAGKTGRSAWDMFFELAEADAVVAPESMNEEQKLQAFRAPWIMIDTDINPTDPARSGAAHPRAFGTFPRVLAKYVRQDGVLTLEDAVRRMTSLAANRLGLRDRGRIAPGLAADVLIFDPQKIQDRATFENPTLPSVGMDYVLINGTPVIDDGKLTQARPGLVLRHEVRPESVRPAPNDPRNLRPPGS